MSDPSRKHLFSPVKVGALSLKHRVVMPPISRLRAHTDGVPSALMTTYYGQRASDGGLIIAESSAVAPLGRPYLSGPGLYSDNQVEGWRSVVKAVHAKGGVIVAQLTHAGRLTSDSITEGLTPVTASVDPVFGSTGDILVPLRDGFGPPSSHRSLRLEEIEEVVAQFRTAAMNAKRAGFDGVEILAAQGHLIQQFLSDGSNGRTDEYGGSFHNRERLLIEIVEALVEVWGEGRVAVRLGPSSTFSGMYDSDPQALYRHLVDRLNRYALSYLHVIEPRVMGAETVDATQAPIASADMRSIFHGYVIAAGGFEPESAEEALANGVADLIAFGRHFTSNPDLPDRIERGYPLTPYERSGFYGTEPTAYIDFGSYQGSTSMAV